jgi:HEAT repeat protein
MKIYTVFAVMVLCCNYSQAQQVHPVAAISDSASGRAFLQNPIKKAKLSVSQSYNNAPTVCLPIDSLMQKILHCAGIEKDSENFDAVIRIDITGSANRAYYSGTLNGYSYGGASMRGSITVERKNGVTPPQQFNESIETPQTTTYLIARPENAPFSDAMFKVLPIILESVYANIGLEPLLCALNDGYWQTRIAAIEAIGALKDERTVGPLVSAFLNTDLHEVKNAASKSLCDMKSKLAIRPLIAGFKDCRDVESILKILNTIDSTWVNTGFAHDAVPGLIHSLKDNDIWTRREAAFALGAIRDSSSLEPLLDAVNDKSSVVRSYVALSLAGFDDNRTVAPLLRMLKDNDPTVRQFSALAFGFRQVLGIKQDERILRSLLEVLRDKEWQVRQGVVAALGFFKDDESVDALIAALKDQEANVCEASAKALGQIKAIKAIDPLIGALENQSTHVRNGAKGALVQITGKDFGNDVSAWKKWREQNK